MLHMGHGNRHASYFLDGVGIEKGNMVTNLGVMVDGSFKMCQQLVKGQTGCWGLLRVFFIQGKKYYCAIL